MDVAPRSVRAGVGLMPEVGSGQYLASQKASLRRLRQYLELAEKGDFTSLVQMIDAGTQNAHEHPNAVILEAILMLNSLTKGTGRSMAGYAGKMLDNFDKRGTHGTGLWVPPN